MAMSNEEEALEEAERRLPEMAGEAFRKARERALKAGRSVVISDAGAIYEVSPAGTRRQLKTIDPPVRLQQRSRKAKLR